MFSRVSRLSGVRVRVRVRFKDEYGHSVLIYCQSNVSGRLVRRHLLTLQYHAKYSSRTAQWGGGRGEVSYLRLPCWICGRTDKRQPD